MLSERDGTAAALLRLGTVARRLSKLLAEPLVAEEAAVPLKTRERKTPEPAPDPPKRLERATEVERPDELNVRRVRDDSPTC